MDHYSERFKRNFADGDWLTTRETQAVLSANSRKNVYIEYVSYIAKREGVRIQDIEGKFFYFYDDVKDLKVSLRRGPPSSDDAPPSPNAARQRAWRARQREKKEQARREGGDQADASPQSQGYISLV